MKRQARRFSENENQVIFPRTATLINKYNHLDLTDKLKKLQFTEVIENHKEYFSIQTPDEY